MSTGSKIRQLIQEAARLAELTALNEYVADFSERVFEDGKAADGTMIGVYSERPWNAKEELSGYSGLLPISKLKGQTFFKGGYKELRGKLGREKEFVNLDLTGSLRLSVKVGQISGNAAVGIVGNEDAKKAKDNEKHFKKVIFGASQPEIGNITKTFLTDFKRQLVRANIDRVAANNKKDVRIKI